MADTTKVDILKDWIDHEILKHKAQQALLASIDFSNPSLAIAFRDLEFCK